MNCSWCQKRSALYEIVVFYLKMQDSHIANKPDKVQQLIRNGVYVHVRVCEACLPVTKESDTMMGRNKKKPTNV